jgi:hypothetical protein
MIEEASKVAFLELTADASASQALAEMKATGTRYCVVIDERGIPIDLLGVEQVTELTQTKGRTLARTSAPPVLLAPADLTLEALAADPIVSLLAFGAAGVVQLREERPVWIVPAKRLRRLMPKEGVARAIPDMSASVDGQLGGPLRTPLGRFTCRQCGYSNTLRYLDERNPPSCQNLAPPPHALKTKP